MWITSLVRIFVVNHSLPFVATRRERVGLQVGRANQASFVRLLRCAGIGLTYAYTVGFLFYFCKD